MTVLEKFVTVLMTAFTLFTSTYSGVNIVPPPEPKVDVAQARIDSATTYAQAHGFTVGITVIDRAQKNKTRTNSYMAHRQYPLESAGRLPILLYAARIDKNVGKGKVPDISAMVQVYSGEATDRLWNKYGKQTIITDLAQRYDLQETTVGESWRDTTMSSFDMAKMIRRFLDDKEVSVATKKYVTDLLQKTSDKVMGNNMMFGLPEVFEVNPGEDNKKLAWAQGWSSTENNPEAVRTTAGYLDDSMRFVVVITGRITTGVADSVADQTMTDIANIAVKDINSSFAPTTGIGEKNLEKFKDKQERLYGNK